jgi:hypothetical protein
MHDSAMKGYAARNGINIPGWRRTCYFTDVYGTSTCGPIKHGMLDAFEERAVSKGNLLRLLGDQFPELTEPHNLNWGSLIPPGKEEFAYWLREHITA